MPGRRIEMGAVRSVNPARREVRVTPRPGRARHFTELRWVFMVFQEVAGSPAPAEMRCRVERVVERADEVVLTLTPGVSRDNVARMKGATVAVDAGEVEEFTVGEYDHLEGLEVVDQAGNRLGSVAAVYATGANDVMEVAKTGGGTLLLPVIPPVIARVERGQGVIVVNEIAPYVVEDAAATDRRGPRR